MAEDELTQTGIRVGRWLPAVPAEPRPGAAGGPRRLPGAPDDPIPPPHAPVPPPHAPGAGSAGEPVPAPGPASAAEPASRSATGPAPTPARAPRSGPTAGPEPDAVAPAGSRRVAPVRHSSRESATGRFAELVGPAASKVRVAVGVAPDGPVTRVGVARARRRRRRVLLGVAVLAVLVLATGYVVREQDAGRAPAVSAVLPGGGAPASDPVAPPPTVVAVTGNPALPGGPLLSVGQERVPTLVDLTVLGARDWIHWGGSGADSVQRKQVGTGEIRDPGGARLEHAASGSGFAWTDGTPAARQDGTRSGVFQRGAGRSFAVAVAGSNDLRTVRLFVGAFSASARLEVRLSSGGDPAVREVPLAAGDRFFQYVIQFRAPRGAQLLVTWRALTVVGGENDGVTMEALAVS
ncbi:hypothetical protein [Micromonospora sp. NPDC050495]|uniref:hypothetical protein n=1 Tax=Micromonospora sp. NPDC050495 TaxID=3154936 RepID=UPI0033C33F0F